MSERTLRRRRCGGDDGRAGKHEHEAGTIELFPCNGHHSTRKGSGDRKPRDAAKAGKKTR